MESSELRARWVETLGEVDLEQLSTLVTYKPVDWGQTPVVRAPTEGEEPFELLEELARGGMGTVYRARQRSLDREVAVKTLRGGGAQASTLSADGAPAFVAEALVTGRLDHPNIVPIYELGSSAAGAPFYAMKLVGGRSWKEQLRERREDLDLQLGILHQVCNAVAFAHSRGIIHNDLKPANVMLGPFGEVLVMDWGLAVGFEADASIRSRETITRPCGTPAYMPPELAEGRGTDLGPHTDIYLLGAILYEILTGHPPHSGLRFLEVIARAARGTRPELPDALPEELASICRKALAPDPRERFARVGELADALRAFQRHRESLRLTRLGRERLRACESKELSDGDRGSLYESFAEAVASFGQARHLWPGNAEALGGEARARLACARVALRAGDFGLAEGQLAQVEPSAERRELCEVLREARDNRERAARQAERNRRRLRRASIGLIVGLAVGLVAAVAFSIALDTERARLAAEQERSGRRESQIAGALESLVSSGDRLLVSVGTREARTIREDILRLSLRQWRELLAVTREHDFAPGIARAELNIGALHLRLGERDAAREALTGAAAALAGDATREGEELRLWLTCQAALAELYGAEDLARAEEAEAAALDALAKLEQSGAPVERPELLVGFAEQRLARGDIEGARELLGALGPGELAGRVGLRALAVRGALLERAGDTAAAVTLYRSAQAAYEPLGHELSGLRLLLPVGTQLAALLDEVGTADERVGVHFAVFELAERLFARDPGDHAHALGLARAASSAAAAALDAGRVALARDTIERGLARGTQPSAAVIARLLAVLRVDAVSQGAKGLDPVVRLWEMAWEQDTVSVSLRVAGARLLAARAEVRGGSSPLVLEDAERACALVRGALLDDDAVEVQLVLGELLVGLCERSREAADGPRAVEASRELLSLCRVLAERVPHGTVLLGEALVQRAFAAFLVGEHREVQAALNELHLLGEGLLTTSSDLLGQVAEMALRFAREARQRGKSAEAARLFELAVESTRRGVESATVSPEARRLAVGTLLAYGRFLEELVAGAEGAEREAYAQEARDISYQALVGANLLVKNQPSRESDLYLLEALGARVVLMADSERPTCRVLLEDGLALAHGLPFEDWEVAERQLAFADRVVKFAEICAFYGERVESQIHFDQAVGLQERLVDGYPAQPLPFRHLINTVQRAFVCARSHGWNAESMVWSDELGAVLALRPEEATPEILRAEATVVFERALVERSAGRLQLARLRLEEARVKVELLAVADRNEGRDRRWLAVVEGQLALACLEQKDLEAAERNGRAALERIRAVHAEYPGDDFERVLVGILDVAGSVEDARGRPEAAQLLWEEAWMRQRRRIGEAELRLLEGLRGRLGE